MDNSRIIRSGDVIVAMGRSYTVDAILYQDYYGDRESAEGTLWWGYDVEFKDTNGSYHHWKQNEDGGNVIRKTVQPAENAEYTVRFHVEGYLEMKLASTDLDASVEEAEEILGKFSNADIARRCELSGKVISVIDKNGKEHTFGW